ncbi:hypothetical protein [Streptomyces sp. NPDC047315]|uniref:hypothetical protein n=1 Tax=Streptomyces sp. NPDC047315 TaxID=3155142 RepID=UPI0033FF9505
MLITWVGMSEATSAQGVFTYTDAATGRLVSLEYPLDAKCYAANASGHAQNGTDKTAQLFDGYSCSGLLVGEIESGGVRGHAKFHWVRFI